MKTRTRPWKLVVIGAIAIAVLALIAKIAVTISVSGVDGVPQIFADGLHVITGEQLEARDRYNEGVAALAKGDYEPAEKALLEARSQAVADDDDLRFRAAYDLGAAFAAHADKLRIGKDADLTRALELAQQALSWFGDADRHRPHDADTLTNLGIMRARIQAISDELRKGEGKLEVRLDHLINDQRGVLDDAREAWLAIKQTGGADPLAQQNPLTQLADRERGILAEAGVIGDLAADEIDAIGKKPEDKRSDEEKVRVIQLKNLDSYLLDGRGRITEARKKLQDLAAEDGVARAEAALVALKRAREQLLDPITVMRQIGQDELSVINDTAASDVHALQLGSAQAPTQLPGWLEPSVIADRQGTIRDRLEEIRARLTAAVNAPEPAPPAAGSGAPPPEPAAKDPKQQKQLERIKAALPSVGEASAEMDKARQSLAEKQIKPALEHEQQALEALLQAVEQFSDLKQAVEAAYRDHQGLLQLLSPEAAKLDPAARAKQTHQLLSGNLARMPRIKALIADAVAELDQHAAQIAGQADKPPPDPKQAEAQKQQVEQAKQQLDQAKQQMTEAETLRGQAEAALGELDKALAGNKDPMPPARTADTKLADLRKLFFSVVEHLQELIREQAETRDQTSAANADDDFARKPKLPGLVDRQTGHGQMAKSITDALAKQADEAAKQPPPQAGPTPPHQGPDAKALAGAADEVRAAQTDMSDAQTVLTKARDATTASENLDPGVKSQAKALEHLAAALKLLQPPPQKNDQKQDQQKQDQQQQQKQDQQKQDQQQQQGGAGQRARDEDAKRQRDRKNRDMQSEPVEKDW